MTKLSYWHDITEKREFGKVIVNQRLEIKVDYEYENLHIEVTEVNLYQNGVFVAEISKLLDKAEGNPLNVMLENINWEDVYQDSKEESVVEKPSSVFDMTANIVKNDALNRFGINLR